LSKLLFTVLAPQQDAVEFTRIVGPLTLQSQIESGQSIIQIDADFTGITFLAVFVVSVMLARNAPPVIILRWPRNGGFRREMDYAAWAGACSASYWLGDR
jgi:hypothetical protein